MIIPPIEGSRLLRRETISPGKWLLTFGSIMPPLSGKYLPSIKVSHFKTTEFSSTPL